jgi:N6-L-threonylcarbamoyladenine synthase
LPNSPPISETGFVLILGIETSCDETSVAVLEFNGDSNRAAVRANLIASQYDAHALFGGVVPEIASRKHLEVINPLLEAARENAGITWRDLDLVAVTNAPGLVGALLVGVAAGKALAFAHEIPCIGVNHLEGHIASLFLEKPDLQFPALALIVSGGHTELVLMRGFNQFERLGKTRDDAVGEAFDKVARALGLPQPGGPHLEKAAREGSENTFDFTASDLSPSLDFSYSGLKTAASQAQRKSPERVSDIAASFQKSAVFQLERNARRALREYSVKAFGVCGGVAANGYLRAALESAALESNVDFVVPDKVLCTDNAAMIAAAGWFRFRALPAPDREYSLPQLGFETHSVAPIAS